MCWSVFGVFLGAAWGLHRRLGFRGMGSPLGMGFLRFDRIIVRLEERGDNAWNVHRHGMRIFAFVKLTLTAIAATQAPFANVV